MAKTAPKPPTTRRPSRGTEKVRKHRDEMRRRGFKLVQFWVPDPSAPGFAEEMRRQSLAVANDPAEKKHLDDCDAEFDVALADPEWTGQ